MSSSSLLLVGCGKMGGALLSSWKDKLRDMPCAVIEPHRPPPINDPNILWNADLDLWVENLELLPQDFRPDVIVFAVKPQSLADILPAYKKRFGSAPLYISIAAGKTLAFYKEHLGDDAKIVRAMPNTPAQVGASITALYADKSLPPASREIANKLMYAAGVTGWLPDEDMMHAITALSGSGPAYIFLFVDALKKAGIAVGLTEDTARSFAIHTFYGAAELASRIPNADFEQLRKNVTSPGGTTEAALSVLMKNDALVQLVDEAVKAATRRSKELSQ